MIKEIVKILENNVKHISESYGYDIDCIPDNDDIFYKIANEIKDTILNNINSDKSK